MDWRGPEIACVGSERGCEGAEDREKGSDGMWGGRILGGKSGGEEGYGRSEDKGVVFRDERLHTGNIKHVH